MASSSVRPINSVSEYNLSRSFQKLGLENHDGFFNTTPGMASSSSSSPSLNLFPAETQEGDLEFSLNQSIRREVDLEYHPFNNKGSTLHSNMYSASENVLGSTDYINPFGRNSISTNPGDYYSGMRNLLGSTDYINLSHKLFGRNPIPTNPGDYCSGMRNYGGNYYPELQDIGQIVSNNQVMSSEIPSNGYYFAEENNLPNIMQSPGSHSTGQCANWGGLNAKNFLAERRNKATLARDEHGLNGLLRLLQIGDPSYTSLVLHGVIDDLMVLVTNEDGFKVFRSLIDLCGYPQMVMIVEKMTSDPTSLGIVASTRFGSYSVQSLIGRLRHRDLARHTELARLVTSALSFGIYSMVSTTWGRNVIKMCLNHLDRRANEVLHEAVIANYYELAMDRGGCIIISNCIDTIESPQRDWLLNRVCEESACLSLDPSGTYVVQKVLGLGNRKYSSMICQRLQGKYISLSLIKHGSYIVEKCLKASGCGGLDYFFREISKDKSLLEKLARHEFGNFVVKFALDVSKEEPSGKYYRFFVKILEPCFQQLEKNTYGVHVVRQIQGLGETSPKNNFGRHE